MDYLAITSGVQTGDSSSDQSVRSTESEQRSSVLMQLPDELQFYILSLLDPQSLFRTESICRRFRRLVNDPFLWRRYLDIAAGTPLPSHTLAKTHVQRKLSDDQIVIFNRIILKLQLHVPQSQQADRVLQQALNGICDAELASITDLSLSCMDLQFLPNIDRLTELRELTLTNNKFHLFPDELLTLTHLKYLMFSRNKLRSIPSVLHSLHSLEYLNLSHNKLRSIPPGIGSLVNLMNLNLDNNHINRLPEEIGELVSLKYLSLGNNDLTELPKGIGGMSNLLDLNIKGNRIEKLPNEIMHLTQLQRIDIRGNLFSDDEVDRVRALLPPDCTIIW